MGSCTLIVRVLTPPVIKEGNAWQLRIQSVHTNEQIKITENDENINNIDAGEDNLERL